MNDNLELEKEGMQKNNYGDITTSIYSKTELRYILEDYTQRIVDNVDCYNKPKFKGDINPCVDDSTIINQLVKIIKDLEL